MAEIDQHPSTELPQKSEWPLDPISTEAIQETRPSQPLNDETSQSQMPSIITPIPPLSREPLAVTSANAGPAPSGPAPYPLTRERTGPAIGPPLEKPMTNFQEGDSGGISLSITLLLISGARHPFKIDERYMKKRNVEVDRNNPVNMSVYTLKELIWQEWRDGGHSTIPSRSASRKLLTKRMPRWQRPAAEIVTGTSALAAVVSYYDLYVSRRFTFVFSAKALCIEAHIGRFVRRRKGGLEEFWGDIA
ncbi:MAG: hypothetical protein Q9188_005919 [Gyalolechia gomerana]